MQKMKIRPKYITLLIVSLVTIISFGQDLKPLNELKVEEPSNNSIHLTKDYILTIKPDKDLFDYIFTLEIENRIKLTDTFEITPYGFNFRLFELENRKGFLLMTEVEYEFISEYPIYLLGKHEIKKIGGLDIRLDCNNCDALNYPLTDIILKGNQNKIEFSFLKDLILINDENIKPYGKNEIIFQYDINRNEFNKKISTGANTGE